MERRVGIREFVYCLLTLFAFTKTGVLVNSQSSLPPLSHTPYAIHQQILLTLPWKFISLHKYMNIFHHFLHDCPGPNHHHDYGNSFLTGLSAPVFNSLQKSSLTRVCKFCQMMSHLWSKLPSHSKWKFPRQHPGPMCSALLNLLHPPPPRTLHLCLGPHLLLLSSSLMLLWPYWLPGRCSNKPNTFSLGDLYTYSFLCVGMLSSQRSKVPSLNFFLSVPNVTYCHLTNIHIYTYTNGSLTPPSSQLSLSNAPPDFISC